MLISVWFFFQSVFYVGGVVGIVWFLIWVVLVTDEPKSHWFISNEERSYVLANRQQTMGEIGARTPPYLKILINPVVWVIMFSDFANSIASYMVIIEGPNFIANILNKDIKSVSQSKD